MSATFDPRTQTFIILAADGVTEIPVSIADVNMINWESSAVSTNDGVQIGACITMLLVLLTLTSQGKLTTLTRWLHITSLLVNIVRKVLSALYFTGQWNEFYATWSGDYSNLSPTNYYQSVAMEILTVIVWMLLQVALGLQAWSMINIMSRRVKWPLALLCFLISLSVVAVRFATAVMSIRAMLLAIVPEQRWFIKFTYIFGSASIFFYCALFNTKLVMHLVQNRSLLPSRRRMSAIEVLVVTNGILMLVPAIFTTLDFFTFTNFEAGSVVYTAVLVIIPLGTMVAQKVAISPLVSFDYPHQNSGTGQSTAPLKHYSPASTQNGTNFSHGTLTSRVETVKSRQFTADPIDMELWQIDNDTPGKGGVRVNHGIEQHEEALHDMSEQESSSAKK